MLAFLVLAGGIAANANELYRSSNFTDDFLTAKAVLDRVQNTADTVAVRLQEEQIGFFRYGGNGTRENNAMHEGTDSMCFYWSMSNGNVADFFLQTEANVHRFYRYNGLDERSILTTLAGNRYYICRGQQPGVPWGYRLIGTQDGYEIYENENALPLGYTYDTYRTKSQMEGQNGAQVEAAMAKSAILEDAVPGYQQDTRQPGGKEVDYQILSADNGLTLEEHAIRASKAGAAMTLEVPALPADGELYFCLSGYRYRGNSKKIHIRVARKDGETSTEKKTVFYETNDSSWPTGKSAYMVNLGVCASGKQEITLVFEKKGKYIFDKMYLWYQPLDTFREDAAKLREDVLENEVIGTDTVTGTIDLEKDKILLLTIPYDGGWTAYVDGKKQKVLKANYMFSALPLAAGHHDIVLKYRTPLLNIGMCISALGCVIFAGILLRRRKVK